MNRLASSASNSGFEAGFETRTSSTGLMMPIPKKWSHTRFAKFWLPDAFVFVDTIPRTSAGKFKKTELRERYRDWKW